MDIKKLSHISKIVDINFHLFPWEMHCYPWQLFETFKFYGEFLKILVKILSGVWRWSQRKTMDIKNQNKITFFTQKKSSCLYANGISNMFSVAEWNIPWRHKIDYKYYISRLCIFVIFTNTYFPADTDIIL